MSYSHVFSESFRDGYPISIFSESELNFILHNGLIKIIDDKFFPKFVGEFVTPENRYFSVPKNFEPTEENIELFKRCLTFYKDLKKDGKTLLTNNVFSVSSDGELKSERYYYNELKEFFLDYITYNFIYPEKHQKFFSRKPISGAKIDVFSTMKMRKQRGPGIVYKVKDIKNTEDWNLDDIYWTTLSELSTKYSTQDDRNQIQEVSEFLTEIGFSFKIIDISDREKILNDIHRCDVGIIHQPIKNTLISYFENKSITTNFKLNIFYTKNFQYVWESIVQKALKHSISFEGELGDLFSTNLPTKRVLSQGDKPTLYRDAYPDLFSRYQGKSFIGDAKYYREIDNSDFAKEMYFYNQIINNQYPMCVFQPWKTTKRDSVREHIKFELIIFKLSVKDAIEDSISGSDRTIIRIQELILKNTNRNF